MKPPRWTRNQLKRDAAISKKAFRRLRLTPTLAWLQQYDIAHEKFKQLLTQLGDLRPTKSDIGTNVAKAYANQLGEALRYLAGPPISDDDLKVLAAANTTVENKLAKDPKAAAKVFKIIEQIIDPRRFPWVAEKRSPTVEEKNIALTASSVLLAAQRVATHRRNDAKQEQEKLVKDYLRALRFSEVKPTKISSTSEGPKQKEFCGECQLLDRKADIVVRLHNSQLLAIECKVSNSAVNSVKRINNDATAKAEYWITQFGEAQIVPATVLSGVFNVLNLEQAQNRKLTLFWAHDLQKLGDFITATNPPAKSKRKQKRQ